MQIDYPQSASYIQILFGFYVAYIFIDRSKFYEKLIEKIWNSFKVENSIISKTTKDIQTIISSYQEFKDENWAQNATIGNNGDDFLSNIEGQVQKVDNDFTDFIKKYTFNKGNLYFSKTFSYISLNQAVYCLIILLIASLKNPLDSFVYEFLLIFASITTIYLYLCWAHECTITTSKNSFLKKIKYLFYLIPSFIKRMFNYKWCNSKEGELLAILVFPIAIFLCLANYLVINLLKFTLLNLVIPINILYWWVILIPIANICFYAWESNRRARAHKEIFKQEFDDNLKIIQESISNLNTTITTARTASNLQLRLI